MNKSLAHISRTSTVIENAFGKFT